MKRSESETPRPTSNASGGSSIFSGSLHKTTNANALPYDPLRSARFIV